MILPSDFWQDPRTTLPKASRHLLPMLTLFPRKHFDIPRLYRLQGEPSPRSCDETKSVHSFCGDDGVDWGDELGDDRISAGGAAGASCSGTAASGSRSRRRR